MPADESDEGQASDESADGQASEAAKEEQTDPQADITELFDDSLLEEEPEGTPTGLNLDDMTFELPGVEDALSLQDLKDGYLRTADYTRKTQAVAAQRKDAEKAISFYEAFSENPKDVVRELAAKAGLIAEDQAPAATIDIAPFLTAEEMQAEIDKRVGEAVSAHPDVLTAQQATAEQVINTAFAELETSREVKLGKNTRTTILKFAQDNDLTDLSIAFDALTARQQERAAKTEALRKVAPSKPSGTESTDDVLEEKTPDTVEEAFELALAGQG